MNTTNHRTMNTKPAQTLLLAAICLPLSAWGGIEQMNRQTDVITPIEADNTDLINSGQPTLESADLPDGIPLDIEVLNNGITASSPGVEGIEDTSQRVWEDGREWTATFVLNTSSNPSGYDITSVMTIAGWGDMRANQKYEVLVSKVSAPDDFLSLGEFSYAPDYGYTSIDLANESGSGAISNGTTTATGVKAIRFRILLPPGTPPPGYTEEQARLLGTAFREIDVLGVPTSAGTAPERK